MAFIKVIEEVNEPEPGPSPEVTFHFVAAKEAPELSPKPTLKPKTPNNQTKELVSAIKKLGKIKADGGKLCEPELFSGKDLRKLKAFIFQCQLCFQSSSDFDDFKKVTFALSYLRDVAQEWFEPGISRLTNEPPVWLDELRSNFGPFDKTGNAKHELTNLCIKNNQHVTDYLV